MNVKMKEVFLVLLSVPPESKTLILCGMCDLCLLVFSFDRISLFPVDRKGVIKLPHSATLIVKLKEGLSNDLKDLVYPFRNDSWNSAAHVKPKQDMPPLRSGNLDDGKMYYIQVPSGKRTKEGKTLPELRENSHYQSVAGMSVIAN
ncbi:hypothetical protein B0H10DRAFT_1951945 [Mycena sp. CBHHK59/15]|nr:hypothetical protein B0H10DRAFT_1951945 [Mycena sp. CBHHK59/15]